MSHLNRNQKAFTIIELLIATTVFTVVILGASVAIIQMSRLYYKGIILSRTQTTARGLTDAIANKIRYGGGEVVKNPDGNITIGSITYTTKSFCIGDTIYSFAVDAQQGAGAGKIAHALWADKANPSCGNSAVSDLNNTPPTSSGKDMLSNNMRVHTLEVTPVTGSNKLYNVNVIIIYGDNDLIDLTVPICKSSIAGSEWCSVVNYSTKVFVR